MNRDGRRLRLVLVLLLLTSFTLITLDYRAGKAGAFRGVRTVVGDVVGPLERAGAAVFGPVGRFFGGLGHLTRYRGDARRLAAQNADLRHQLASAGDLARETAQLRAVLGTAGADGLRIVPARVISYGDLSGFDDTVTLGVGSRDGVRPDTTVINGAGLVGRVKTVSAFTCSVVLADDPQAAVGARVTRDGGRGLVAGEGAGRALRFTAEDTSEHPRAGDVLTTFGSRLFVPGVPVGTVTRNVTAPGALTQTVEVTPFVRFGALDIVGVVVPAARTVPLTPTLPPPPTVRVTVTATVTVTAGATAPPSGPGAPTSGAAPAGSSAPPPSATAGAPSPSPTPSPSGSG